MGVCHSIAVICSIANDSGCNDTSQRLFGGGGGRVVSMVPPILHKVSNGLTDSHKARHGFWMELQLHDLRSNGCSARHYEAVSVVVCAVGMILQYHAALI